MISTGNDIVSLSARNYHCIKKPAVYLKILSTTEKSLFNDPALAEIPFENFVWLVWSLKESAYKYLQRIMPDLIFSPTKFIVQELHLPDGFVVRTFEPTEREGIGFDTMDIKNDVPVIKATISVATNTLYSRSFIFNELIVSVVNGDENFENTCWGIKWIAESDPESQSKAVRIFLMNRLHQLVQKDNLAISKSPHGFPIVSEGNEEMSIAVSLSHHDHLVAYSFQTDDFQTNCFVVGNAFSGQSR